MSTSPDERPAGTAAEPRTRRERQEWWATLAPDALEDETRTNRRRERWLFLSAGVALAATLVVLALHAGPLFS
ncbi:hypothetical protein [Isoptericola sp. NPDC056573]|uniref:hypothetical protein n=1 Tax=unclassified Isoptericola TaxID=2623355 RepID=UPI0036C3BBFB